MRAGLIDIPNLDRLIDVAMAGDLPFTALCGYARLDVDGAPDASACLRPLAAGTRVAISWPGPHVTRLHRLLPLPSIRLVAA